ncbi:MAG TPA: hypothetical protein VFK18_01975 [Luteimonas sp.]|nr:hypothetical protein [Luteimonas sp.]
MNRIPLKAKIFCIAVVAFIAVGVLSMCTAPAQAAAQAIAAAQPADPLAAAQAEVASSVHEAQASMASVAVPTLVAAQDLLSSSLPAKPLAAPTHQGGAVSPAAVDMIVSFEIVSPAYYAKRLQHPVWPGGESGVTWGIGYDGGYQTSTRILEDWATHPERALLSRTAGITGAAAKPLASQLRVVETPLLLAEDVFAHVTLPRYARLAMRTFDDGWTCLDADPQGSLVATVYNRGTSMRGRSRAEMRQLRDDCVPRCDVPCMAAAYRAMKRVWKGTALEAGLGRRYEATARLAEGRWP